MEGITTFRRALKAGKKYNDRVTIKSEMAYKLETYRVYFYAPIVAGLLVQIFLSFYYTLYFRDLLVFDFVAIGLGILAAVAFLCFGYQSRFVSFYAMMGMEEWRHGTYERYLFNVLWGKIKTYPYIPALSALCFAGLYFFLLQNGLISHIPNGNNADSNNGFGLIWQIHASILGLVFVTLSFLIGLLNADELNKKIDAGKRLANRLHFKSITVANTLFTLWVGYTALASKVNVLEESLTIFALLFLVFSIIYLFQNFMRYLFEMDLLRGLILAELKSNLRKSLRAEIRAKVSEQFLQKIALEEQIYVGYDSPDAFSRPIPGDQKGLVIDVDIPILKRFSRSIQTTIPVKDYFKGTTEYFKAVLLKGFAFNSPITERRESIALVAKEEKPEVDSLTQKVFKIKDFEQREEFAENLKELSDNVVRYLKVAPNKSIETIEFIGALIDESLEVMREYQIKFDYETSKQLTHFDWRSIGLLVFTLDDIFKEIYSNGGLELIKRTISFIDDRIDSAIKQHNHYLFKEFFGNYVRMYYLAFRSENISTNSRKIIVEDIHNKIIELFKYRLRLGEDDASEPEEFQFHKGVAMDIQKISRELNKTALEDKDLDSLRTFSKTLKKVSSTLDRHQDIRALKNEVEIIRLDIESNGSSKTKEAKITLLNGIIELNESLHQYGSLSQFALGSWAVDLFRRQELDDKLFTEVLAMFQPEFNGIQAVTEAFFEIKKDYRQDALNLSHWEMGKSSDGEVHTIRMDWPTYFYILTVLKYIPETITLDQFIYGDGVKEYSSSYLEVILKEIENAFVTIETNKVLWKPMFPDKNRIVGEVEQTYDDLSKKGNLLELHRRGIERRKQEESDFLAKTPIDEEILINFKKDFLKEYHESKSLKQIFREQGLFVDLTQESAQDEEAFGIKTLDFKYHYIKDWYISTHGIPEHFASAMIRGENTRISATMLSAISDVSPIETDDELLPRIDKMINNLTTAGYKPNVILIGNWIKLYRIRRSPDFIGEREPRDSDYQGTYRGTRVYYVQGEELHNKVLVLDLAKLGIFTQRQVKGERGTEIYINVRIITDADIDLWVKKDVEVIKRNGIQMSREEIQKYMGERVLLDILQKFDFSISDKKAGLYALVKD